MSGSISEKAFAKINVILREEKNTEKAFAEIITILQECNAKLRKQIMQLNEQVKGEKRKLIELEEQARSVKKTPDILGFPVTTESTLFSPTDTSSFPAPFSFSYSCMPPYKPEVATKIEPVKDSCEDYKVAHNETEAVVQQNLQVLTIQESTEGGTAKI